MPRPLSRAGAAVAAVALVAVLAACTAGPAPTPTPTPPPPSGDGVLRIGTLFTMTGPGSGAGATQAAAVNAAVRAIDAAGGVNGYPVEVVNRNGGVAGDGAAEAAFAQLVERGVDVVIGPSTTEIAALLVPLAREAGVPLVSSSALGVRPDGAEGVLFRTVPAAHAQGVLLPAELGGAGSVALLRGDDAVAQAFAAGLSEGVEALEGTLAADVVLGEDSAASAAEVAASAPDAVVVATDGGEATAALLAALVDSGISPEQLWLTGAALARYRVDDAGSLEGAHGLQAGAALDPALAAAVRQEDPGIRSLRFAAEAYDAVTLVALAAVLAGDDGGRSIAASLPAAGTDGIPCTSFGECLAVLADRPDVALVGASGAAGFDAAGDRLAFGWARSHVDADNAVVADGAAP